MHLAGMVQLQAQTVKRQLSTFLPPTASLLFFSSCTVAAATIEPWTFYHQMECCVALLLFVLLFDKNKHQIDTSNCILRCCCLYKTCARGQRATLFNGGSDLGGRATEQYTST